MGSRAGAYPAVNYPQVPGTKRTRPPFLWQIACLRSNSRITPMRLVGVSLAVIGLSSLFMSAVLVHAVLTPVSHQAKPQTAMSGWTTTLTRE